MQIDRDALRAYDDMTINSLADVPTVSWRDQDGRTRRCRLWMFAVGHDARFGVESVRAVRAELGTTLQAAVLEAHRKRKRKDKRERRT